MGPTFCNFYSKLDFWIFFFFFFHWFKLLIKIYDEGHLMLNKNLHFNIEIKFRG